MKITELRCPACNGTMKIDQNNPNIAVCEYCHSKYVLEREGDDARINSSVSNQNRAAQPAAFSPKKENNKGKNALVLAAASLLIICGAAVSVFSHPASEKKTSPLPAMKEGAQTALEDTKEELEAEFSGIFADGAEAVFGKPADQISDSELASVRWIRVRYANGGEDICVDYSMENPMENPEAEMESAYFDRSGADMDFKALERFSGLVKLDVMNYLPNESLKGLNLESLSCYAESPKALHEAFGSSESLKELEISAGMESLEGLELFPSVETLVVDGYHLTDIKELAAAKNVKYLTLENCDEVKDFSVLSVMSWLEGLSVESENLKALTFLSNMPGLKSLGLYDGGMINLSGLSDRAETLTSLTIDSCDELKDCSEISALSHLTKLTLEVPYNCSQPDLSGLTAMEELTISGFDSVSFLTSMTALRKLSLNSVAVDDGSVFKSLASLTDLTCTSFSGNLDNLEFIAGLPALKRLNLTGASTYYDISSLFNISTLESFTLNGMECEINFDKLQDNPSLKELHMDGIKLYKNVKVDGGGGILYVDWDDVILDEHTAFLSHYPNLETLSIADNELTQAEFAAILGNLKTLDISENYVTDIKPLTGAVSLRTLNLTGNPVDNTRVLSEKVHIIQ